MCVESIQRLREIPGCGGFISWRSSGRRRWWRLPRPQAYFRGHNQHKQRAESKNSQPYALCSMPFALKGGRDAKKILIVDDDPDLVEAVTMILESKNTM